MSANSNEKIEIREPCKGVHRVDLGESFPTSFYLQMLASIQPRTSSPKFAEASKRYPPPVIKLALQISHRSRGRVLFAGRLIVHLRGRRVFGVIPQRLSQWPQHSK